MIDPLREATRSLSPVCLLGSHIIDGDMCCVFENVGGHQHFHFEKDWGDNNRTLLLGRMAMSSQRVLSRPEFSEPIADKYKLL